MIIKVGLSFLGLFYTCRICKCRICKQIVLQSGLLPTVYHEIHLLYNSYIYYSKEIPRELSPEILIFSHVECSALLYTTY